MTLKLKKFDATTCENISLIVYFYQRSTGNKDQLQLHLNRSLINNTETYLEMSLIVRNDLLFMKTECPLVVAICMVKKSASYFTELYYFL